MNANNFEDGSPPPFPKGLPTIDLPKISLSKLLDGDEDEAQTLFDICTRTGFFYLDLMDHPKGRKFWESACLARQIGAPFMSTLSMEEKDTFKQRQDVGILDRGYNCRVRDEDGQPKYVESINIPRDELFSGKPSDWKLPASLTDDEAVFKALMREGNTISNIILGILERQLQLPSGSFTSCHRLEEPSHSFLRILRYPALKAGHELDTPRFFAHRDIVTLAILVTWVCGFQIPKEDAEMIGPDEETEDSWRWVEPLPGYALINLGDAMPIFTHDKLKSGKHRVVTAYGDQSLIDRYSVLVSARPSHVTPMKAFKSPMIPEDTPEEADAEVLSAKTWGDGCVKRFIKEKVKVKAKD